MAGDLAEAGSRGWPQGQVITIFMLSGFSLAMKIGGIFAKWNDFAGWHVLSGATAI
jgi:hypothetical protein